MLLIMLGSGGQSIAPDEPIGGSDPPHTASTAVAYSLPSHSNISPIFAATFHGSVWSS